jgi:hypothetical protein
MQSALFATPATSLSHKMCGSVERSLGGHVNDFLANDDHGRQNAVYAPACLRRSTGGRRQELLRYLLTVMTSSKYLTVMGSTSISPTSSVSPAAVRQAR